jgi:hypothetical protein
VTSVSQGAFTVTRPALGAGTPAVFIAKAGKANSAKRTVAAGVIVTSRAGRGQGDWFATAIHAKVPTGFTVTMSANARSTMTGHAVEFDAFATYTLRSTASGPDGSTTAWYDLEEGGVETGRATLDRTSGCRYEAPLSGDGELQSADFELRVLPNGEVVYGFLYHTRFHGTYVATDCPPGTVMPPVETDIAVKLDSRRPGPQSLRSGPASFEFDVTDATDAQAGVYDKVTASWLVAPH